jgi:hypothetical protein
VAGYAQSAAGISGRLGWGVLTCCSMNRGGALLHLSPSHRNPKRIQRPNTKQATRGKQRAAPAATRMHALTAAAAGRRR